MDRLYSLYSQSRALKIACHDIGLQFDKVGRVLEMRWMSSSFKTVKAVWTSFGALYSHFTNSLKDTTIDANLKSTFISLRKRLGSPKLLLDLGLKYVILQEICMLSSELRTQMTTLSKAKSLIKRIMRVIESFKDEPGDKT
jgi:hypothetical protein